MNLSIKKVPEPLVQRQRERAARRHGSIQGALLDMLETSLREDPVPDLAGLMAEVRGLGLTRRSESAEIIRAERDGR